MSEGCEKPHQGHQSLQARHPTIPLASQLQRPQSEQVHPHPSPLACWPQGQESCNAGEVVCRISAKF